MTPSAALPLIPRAKLFGNPTRAQAQISPDGRWLSWIAPKDGVLNIWLAPAGDIVAECLRRLADVHYLLGTPQDALACVDEGLRVAETCGERYEVGFQRRDADLECPGKGSERVLRCQSARAAVALQIESHRRIPSEQDKKGGDC